MSTDNSDVDVLHTLICAVVDKLEQEDYEESLRILKGKEYEDFIKHNSLEVVPMITHVLVEDFCNMQTENCIEEMLNYIAQIANPKEALIVLTEEIDSIIHVERIKILLTPLQTILLHRLPTSSKSSLFSMVFKAVNDQVKSLAVSVDHNLEDSEKKLLDSDPTMLTILDTLGFILEFYDKFYIKVLSKELVWPDKGSESQEFLSFFILQILEGPLVFMDIYLQEGDSESAIYSLCTKFVNMVTCLNRNPFKLLEYIKPRERVHETDDPELAPVDDISDEEEDEDKHKVSQLSLSMYFYSVVGQGMSSSSVPYIYSHNYLFISCLPSCLYLVDTNSSLVIHKGLVLFKSLLNNLDDKSLPNNCLEVPSHFDMLRALLKVMTTCNNTECKKLALKCFRQWIWKFSSLERLQLFSILFIRANHSGVLGVVTYELKESIRLNLVDSKVIDDNFTGTKIQDILSLVCKLPQGEKTDLLEWSDKILGALNLLIFIHLHDPQNVTKYRPVMPQISKEFLLPLENGLRISKGHYELKLKELNESTNKASNIEMSVNGGTFPEIPIEHEKEMIAYALNWFDLMQSIWARANKLVSEHIESLV